METASLDLGYLTVPEGGGPGIVLVHDVWGLAEHTRDFARRFAAAGFVTLAVDLYAALGPVEIREPGPFMQELSDPDLVETVGRAARFLREHPAVRGRPVGVVGFCMGGTYALLSGAELAGLAAVVSFYGVLSHRHGLYHSERGLDPAKKPREPLEAVRDLRCPTLAFFGEDDPYISAEDVAAFRERVSLGSAAAPVEIQVYPGAGHAFMNDTRPAAFRPDVARDAFERTLLFLRSALGRAPSP